MFWPDVPVLSVSDGVWPRVWLRSRVQVQELLCVSATDLPVWRGEELSWRIWWTWMLWVFLCVCVCVCLFFNFYYLPPTWPLSYILRVFVCAPVQTVNGLAGSGIWSTRQSFCRSQCTLTLGFVSVKANLMFFLTDKKLSLLWKSTHHFGKLPSPVTKGILGEWVGRWKGIELLLSGISGSLSFFVFCFVFPDITVMVDWA